MRRPRGSLRFALVVTSDRIYRGLARDRHEPLVRRCVEDGGHVLVYTTVAPNRLAEIRRAILDAAARADIVLVTGGTGPGPRDLSVEAARLVSEKELPGVGELHRAESKASVGRLSASSRASAFIVSGSLVAVSPGSPDAVRTMLRILLDIGPHLVAAARGASRWLRGASPGNP